MTDTARPTTGYKPSISHLKDSEFGDHGGRAFFLSRGLGIREATNDDFDIRVVHAKPGSLGTTGWHYHTCSFQAVYCVRGWEDLEFEDGTKVRLEPGSCIHIPPGFRHIETGYSEDFEVIVITSPASIGTTNVDSPV